MRSDCPVALLIHPPVYDFAFYDLFAKPYGLLKVGRWLQESGWTVRFVNALDAGDPASVARHGAPVRKEDGTGKIWRQLLEPTAASRKIERRYCRYGITHSSFAYLLEASCGRKPDLICIGTGMTYWYEGVRETVELCRRLFPGVPVAAGGIYASLLPDHCTGTVGTDYAVRGEAWPSLSRLLTGLGLPAPDSPPVEAVLPLREVWADAGVIRLNKGCPFTCDYCASRMLCPSFEAGDPDAAFSHLQELHTRCGTVNFAFFDDALLVNRDRVLKPFLRKVIEAGSPFRFYLPNAVHVRYLDEHIARLMKAAGFMEVRMGFESSSADFHSRHDGKFQPEDFRAGVANLRAAGFSASSLSVYVLAGLPGQTACEVEESVRYAGEIGIRVHIAEYSPVPGTAFWKESVERCPFPLAEEPLYHNNTFFPMEWERFTRADLDHIKRLARNLPGGKTA